MTDALRANNNASNLNYVRVKQLDNSRGFDECSCSLWYKSHPLAGIIHGSFLHLVQNDSYLKSDSMRFYSSTDINLLKQVCVYHISWWDWGSMIKLVAIWGVKISPNEIVSNQYEGSCCLNRSTVHWKVQ